MESKFNRDVANREVLVNAEQAMLINETSGSADVVRGGTAKKIGIATGITIKQDGTTLIEVLRNNALYLVDKDTIKITDTEVANYYYKQADKYLSTLLENQKEIAYQLSICSLLIQENGAKAEQYKGKLQYLFERWKQRNEDIEMYCQNVQTTTIQQFDNSLKTAGIGLVLSAGLILIITAVISVSFASLAWYCYYNESNESRRDARDLIELNKLLADLDETTKTKVFKIINEYGDDNYKKGARKILMQNIVGGLKKFGIFALCGLILYKVIKDRN